MIRRASKRKQQKIQDKLETLFATGKHGKASGDYDEMYTYLKEVFKDNDPINFRQLQTGRNGNVRVCLISCDGLTDTALIDNHLLRPLMEMDIAVIEKLSSTALVSNVFQVLSVKKTNDYNEIIEAITYGDTLVIMDGLREALLFDTKCFQTRSISEPEGEKILSGPREGFTEALMQNLGMLRRKLRTENLKMRYLKLGRQTKTQLCVAYLDGVAKPEVLKELNRRLEKVNIDGILDANYINELIRDHVWSPFRSMGYTERPDVVAAKLLEGRVALFVDGTPVVLTLPYLFIENFQSNEDYYLSFYYTTFSRFLRILGFFMTTMLPAVYISIVAYHQEMLPSPLMISIAAERQTVPLPSALEAVIMLVLFEILRETALRMQGNVGQAMSIVGALVVGQAAVEAKLVAAPMLIVIATSGITSLLVPKMNASILLIRFGMLLLASCMGFLGLTAGCALLLVHVLDLNSFGVWQLASDHELKYQNIKDTIIRAPWHQMILRPKSLTRNSNRQPYGTEEQP